MASNIKKKKKKEKSLLEECELPKNTAKVREEVSVVLQKPKEESISRGD